MSVNHWRTHIPNGHPAWAHLSDLLDLLPPARFPSVDDLNRLLSDDVRNRSGRPVRFVPAERLGGEDYEERIYATGEISTRSASWHDLFNALVWLRYPALKSAMNAAHHAAIPSSGPQGRGSVRDAITLFDECGIIVASTDRAWLQALAGRDWQTVFVSRKSAWAGASTVHLVGHATFEKLLSPYKAMTANALLVHVDGSSGWFHSAGIVQKLAGGLLAGRLLGSASDLSPLPLAGIPGWWSGGVQDAEFLADPAVFRPPSPGFRPAPVFDLS